MGLLDTVIEILGDVETTKQDAEILGETLKSAAVTASEGMDTLKELQDDARAGKPPGTLRTAFEIGSFLLRR